MLNHWIEYHRHSHVLLALRDTLCVASITVSSVVFNLFSIFIGQEID